MWQSHSGYSRALINKSEVTKLWFRTISLEISCHDSHRIEREKVKFLDIRSNKVMVSWIHYLITYAVGDWIGATLFVHMQISHNPTCEANVSN